MAEKKSMKKIDRDKVKEELERKQILDIQKELVKDRRLRLVLMSFLLGALLFTVSYGSIENPFQYTFSKIGNRFNIGNRVLFVVWAISVGTIVQASILALFEIEKYRNKRQTIFIVSGSIFLIATAAAPSLPDLPFWTWVHLVTAGLFAVLLSFGFIPFAFWVARENPRLTRVIHVWLGITWGGGIFWYITLGNTGMFEMWFFVFFIVFLLYLSLVLFEEKIVKQSTILLRDEDNLNLGIEKIFINLEKEKKRKKQARKKSKQKQKG
ncbi:hypothetical protein KQ51_01325 [Candidatus Izimaplasma bacterium HR1]|jgi:hypothetical protein|uniref:hypothetical protein n=1 Tax=Candidatus Izimoplasma sp. HR1 TaxID=1541959 RepID=UPI0004F83D82|nr:hypothetical protein KQ51_01325 [Candidatus Izimaplasma bacterium HR1]